MAVYTEVSDEELERFIAEYDIGEVVSCKGIAEGVENSNYLLHTEKGQYILTLYERRVAPTDLPYFLNLMEHLAVNKIPCPTPLHGKDGKSLRTLCGRPAAIITFLAGMWPRRVQPYHCAELGEALAKFHLAGASFGLSRRNNLSVDAWRPLFDSCADRADTVQQGLSAVLSAELTQDQFEDILDAHEAFATIDRTIRRALNDARERGYDEENIKSVLMVGGSSQIPSVQRTLRRIFGQERVMLNRPLDAVAK